MNWFYESADQKQAGPVDVSTLEKLHRNGAVTGETLVWQEGMGDWKPYSSIFAPLPADAPPLPGGSRCAECGQSYPPQQLISLAGRDVCATCKPKAVQKLQEGLTSFGTVADAEQLWQEVEKRGFDFTISSVLSRSWTLVKGNFWPCVGVTLLCYLIMMGAGQIPLLGLLATFFVQPQIMAGLNWYFLKQFRGEAANINDSFAGFRRGFGQQALYMLILFAIIIAIVIVCAIPIAIVVPIVSSPESEGPVVLAIAALVIPAVVAIWYFMICWLFTPLLILEKGLKATAAMKLSRRVVRLRFWKIVGLMLVMALLGILGLLALVVGLIVVLPVVFAALTRLYEDAFGERSPETAA
jgi:uncharacterized membrane protein